MLNLAEYKTKPTCLADYLPWACLAAPGIVLNKDGSFQRTLRYRGPDLESSTPEQLVSFTARLNNMLKRLGSGWAMFFEASRQEATAYPDSEFPDPASWLVDEERRGQFEELGTHFETYFYLTLCWLPPSDNTSRVEALVIDDPSDAPKAFWQDSLASFEHETARAFDLVSGLMPEAAWLDDDETLTYLHACISLKRHNITTPPLPSYLDACLADCSLTGGLAPMLGNHALRVVSVLGYPAMTEPGLLSALDGLGFAYRWVTRFLPLDKTQAEKTLTRYRRQWFAKRKSVLAIMKETLENEPSQLVNTDADNKAADVDFALQSLGQDQVAFGNATIAIAVTDETPSLADSKARAIERVLNERGFVAINEDLNTIDAWLGTHPGNAYANVRQPLIHTLNLAHMAPLSAIWAGPERNEHLKAPALILARSNTATPFRVVTHHSDVGHTMVVGPTGAGKSVLLSLIAMQFRRYKQAQVFVFDKGRSARAAMTAMGAETYELGLDGALALQPLSRINEEAECAFAQDWVLGLLEQEGVKKSPAISDAIWTALQNLADAPQQQRTLTGLVALIQSSELRQALTPYTLKGPYGGVLDADHESLTTETLSLFEMEELIQIPRLAGPVLSFIFHRLEERFDGSPSLVLLDEFWDFLSHPMFASRIRAWLKTLRKKNVSVIFFTQSLSDIAASQIAPTLIESCPTRIFLPNARADEPGQADIYDAFGLNARQIQLIARATPKREYYLQCPDGNRLFDLELGEVALAFCGSGSKADQAAMDELLSNKQAEHFAQDWLRHQGLDWAADILNTQAGGQLCAAE